MGVKFWVIGVVKDIILTIRDENGFIINKGGFGCEYGFNLGYCIIKCFN